MQKRRTDILNGKISEQILLFFFPILLGTFFQQLYNTFDAIIVGNYVGKEALAAVGGTTGTLISLLINFTVGVASGATVIVAQCYGNRDVNGVKKGAKSGMYLGIVIGAVLMVTGIAAAPMLLHILNVPSDIFNLTLTYMRIYFIGFIPVTIYNIGAGILRAIGDSKRPFYFLVVSCLTNIVLDFVLVRIIPLGVAGAAIATVLSQVVACLLTLYILYSTGDIYHYDLRYDFGYEKDVLIRIVKLGLPSGITSILYSVSNLFIQSTVNTFGTDTIAAYTAFGKIDGLFWMTTGAMGSAVMTIVGQNFGAGNIPRVKKTVKDSLIMLAIISIAISAGLFFGGNFVLSLFTNDANVIRIGLQMLRFLCPFWVTFIFIEIMGACIRACGEPVIPTCMTAVGVCGLRIVWIALYPYKTLLQALYCYPISWILTSLLFLSYYLAGNWLEKCLKKREEILS